MKEALIIIGVALTIVMVTFMYCAILINREENDEWKKK